MFTYEQIKASFPELTENQVRNALMTLKDVGRIYGWGRGTYEVAQAFPKARLVSVSRLEDGWWLLEIGDQSIAITEEEASRVGEFLGARVVQRFSDERIKRLEQMFFEVQRRQQLADRRAEERKKRAES